MRGASSGGWWGCRSDRAGPNQRGDAAALREPDSARTCRRLQPIRVHDCPGCADVDGHHFHRLCPCGARWESGPLPPASTGAARRSSSWIVGLQLHERRPLPLRRLERGRQFAAKSCARQRISAGLVFASRSALHDSGWTRPSRSQAPPWQSDGQWSCCGLANARLAPTQAESRRAAPTRPRAHGSGTDGDASRLAEVAPSAHRAPQGQSLRKCGPAIVARARQVGV